jgi:hypothetical protein
LPATSFTLPLVCSAEPLMRSLSMCEPFMFAIFDELSGN